MKWMAYKSIHNLSWHIRQKINVQTKYAKNYEQSIFFKEKQASPLLHLW
jgi:hypothetical protein